MHWLSGSPIAPAANSPRGPQTGPETRRGHLSEHAQMGQFPGLTPSSHTIDRCRDNSPVVTRAGAWGERGGTRRAALMDEAQPRRRRGGPTEAVLHPPLLRQQAEQRAEMTHLHPPETEKPGTEGASTPLLPQEAARQRLPARQRGEESRTPARPPVARMRTGGKQVC